MALIRSFFLAVLFIVAVALQTVFLRPLAIVGVVPDLVLLLVVATGYARGAEFGAVVGFAGGLVLDLAPPADHVAGRWALALVLAGFLAGRVRADARSSVWVSMLVVAACSFIATSTYVITGAIVGDTALGSAALPTVIAVSVGLNVVVSPIVIPVWTRLLRSLGMAG